jgi:hypothetical protein
MHEGLRPRLPGDALVTDASAAYSQERHDNALGANKGYCRQRTTDELLAELSGARQTGASPAP